MSTITAWRLVKDRHVGSAFSGIGAKKEGGRWNSPGVAVVYTAESLSLATLEIVVHLRSVKKLKQYKCVSISFDFSCIIDLSTPPAGWDQRPPGAASQSIGDDWINNNISAVLKVPSVIIPGEAVYIINPYHPDFTKMSIGPALDFPYDSRLHKAS